MRARVSGSLGYCGCNCETVGFDRRSRVRVQERVRSGEGEMKCWGFLEKGNRMEPTRPVQSVLRFCGQRAWPNSSKERRQALGGRGPVRPHFQCSHFQESALVCTATQYNAGQVHGTSVPRTGTA